MAGQTPALQQHWQSSEKLQHFKETQYLMNTLYLLRGPFWACQLTLHSSAEQVLFQPKRKEYFLRIFSTNINSLSLSLSLSLTHTHTPPLLLSSSVQILETIRFISFREDSLTRGQSPIFVTGHWRIHSYV